MKESLEEDETSLYEDDEEGYLIENGQHKRLDLKMKAIFQILFYQAAHGRKNTSLHILNIRAIYEHCHSRELITAFNRQGCSANHEKHATCCSKIRNSNEQRCSCSFA